MRAIVFTLISICHRAGLTVLTVRPVQKILITQHNLVVLNLKLNPTDYPDRSCDESSASVPGRHSLRVHQD